MSLRGKLTFGLVFLFLIIFALVIYGSFEIQKLSADAKAIIKDNYDSLVYCKQMLLALDDIKMAYADAAIIGGAQLSQLNSQMLASGKSVFETSLSKEQNNITEIHEQDYVNDLSKAYSLLLNLGAQVNATKAVQVPIYKDFLSAYLSARQTISRIDDVNMEAVKRKNDAASADAARMTISFAIVGSICLILAFFYFWYFPFYVSNSVTYLVDKMRSLLKGMGISLDTKTKDEAFIMLHAMNLIENSIAKSGEKAKKKRVEA